MRPAYGRDILRPYGVIDLAHRGSSRPGAVARGCACPTPGSGYSANQALKSRFRRGARGRSATRTPTSFLPEWPGATARHRRGRETCAVREVSGFGEPSAEEPAYRTNFDRVTHRDELVAKLAVLTARFSSHELLKQLEAVQVPAGPIHSLDQVFADPHVIHRGMRIDLPNPAAKGGKTPGVRTPLTLGGARTAAPKPAPAPRRAYEEILREIGER